MKAPDMEAWDERQKRAHEAGIRLAITETEVAASLLSRIAALADPKEKARSLREARATVELASRLVSTMLLPDPRCDEISDRIRTLRERLDEWTAVFPDRPVRRARLGAMSRSL